MEIATQVLTQFFSLVSVTFTPPYLWLSCASYAVLKRGLYKQYTFSTKKFIRIARILLNELSDRESSVCL